MTRIASFSQSSALVEHSLSRQLAVNEAQLQVATGKKAQTWSGYGAEVSLLVSSRSLLARTESYGLGAKQLGVRLSQVDLHLTTIKDMAGELKKSILDALALESGEGLQTRIDQHYKAVVNSLNAEYDGQYLFAGSHVEQKPVVAADLNQLVALPAVANAFRNDSFKAEARIADSQDIAHGMVASELGGNLLQVFRDLHSFDTGVNGPLDGKINPTQRAFLEAQLLALDTAIDGVQDQQLANGARQQQVEAAGQRHTSRITDLKSLISNIEDVDAAEAITRLQSNRSALEASYQILSKLDRLSLNNYL
jgi:flagellar hook-associated protein 3 FlgL